MGWDGWMDAVRMRASDDERKFRSLHMLLFAIMMSAPRRRTQVAFAFCSFHCRFRFGEPCPISSIQVLACWRASGSDGAGSRPSLVALPRMFSHVLRLGLCLYIPTVDCELCWRCAGRCTWRVHGHRPCSAVQCSVVDKVPVPS